MMHRIGTIALAGMLVAGTATGLTAGGTSAKFSGPAVPDDLGGTVAHVDTVAHTITFTDGRIVHYDPLWRILVNGREVAITEVAPGAVIAMAPAGTPTRVMAPGTPQRAAAQVPVAPGTVTHPPITASGTVTHVDPAARTITFEDGRTVTVPEGHVWQAVPLDRILPGTQVSVTNAVPAGTVRDTRGAMAPPATAAPGWVWTDREMTGRVAVVEPRGSQIVLADGTTVLVTPSTSVQTTSAQAIAVNELRPGDQVVVQVQQVVPIVDYDAGETTAFRRARGDMRTTRTDIVRTPSTVRTEVSPAGTVRTEVTPPAMVRTDVTTPATERELRALPSHRFPNSARVAADRVVVVRRAQAP